MMNNNGIGKIIQPIFSPAISVLSRINYTRKFTLLWLISLVAVAVVTYSLFVSLDRIIQPSHRELEGLMLIEPVSRTVQLIQLHRGVSVALLGGTETKKDRLAAQEREAAEAFKAMEGKLPPSLVSSEDFLRIKAGWERLRKEGLHWEADENFAAHTRLIGQLQSFELSIADDYALILDAELDTYYLIDTNVNKLPHVLEHLGQLRAYGTGVLARKQITGRQKIKLNNLIAELDSSLHELSVNIGKTGRHNPAVQKSLLAAYDGIAASARQITGLVESDILAGHFATPPDVFLDMATAEIDNGYTQMHQVLLPTTQALIEARIARAENTLLVTVSLAALLFMLAIYFSVAMYYAIVGSVRSLVRSAQTFAEGNLSQRIILDTRDELSQIGDSFNKMADGFNVVLEERTQAVHALYKSEKLYRSLFENMLNGVAYCQMIFEQGQPQDFIYLSVNAAFETQTGLKNVAGKRVSEVIPGIRQSDPGLFEVFARVSLSGKPERLEIYLTSLQQWFWVSAYCPAEGHFVAVFDVITERRRAEDALRESKDLLQSVMENAPAHIFWKDRDSRYLGCNTNFAKGAGYSSPDQVVGKTDLEMAWKNYAESYRADDKAVMESGIPKLGYEEPFTTPDGKLAWARTSKVTLRDSSKRIIGVLGIYEDITARKQAEQELVKSRQRAQQYLDTAGVMLMALDVQGRVQMINRTGCEMLGHSEADILGKDWFDNFLPEPARKEVRNVFARVLDGGNVVSAEYFENDILTASGDVLTVAWHNSPLPDESGKIIGTLSSGEDITARKRAEKSLLESKFLFSTTFDLAAVGIARVAPDGRWLDVNNRLCDIVGYTREELLAGTFQDITHPDDLETDLGYVHQMLAGEIPTYSMEKRYFRKSGEIVWINLSVALVRRDDGSPDYFISVIEDINERKRMEAELFRLNQELEQKVAARTADLERARFDADQANRAKSEFLSAMSHEIRTPMNGVVGMLDVLQQSSLNSAQMETVNIIHDSAFALLAIIDDILDFSKIEAGKLQIDHAPMNVAGVVEGVCEPLVSLAAKKGVELTLFTDPAIPARVLGDAGRLRQILVNLANNAIKFSGGLQRRGKVSVRAILARSTPQQATLEFRIIDNGIGIDEATQRRLFSAFTQADVSTTRTYGGTGLGLAISRQLANLMGGEIAVQSKPGKGSVFSVRVPFEVLPEQPDVNKPPLLVAGLPCLVIGDAESLADDLAAYLEHAGAQVERGADIGRAGQWIAGRPSGLCIVVIDTAGANLLLDDLRAAARTRAEQQTRFVVIGRGQLRKPRLEAADLVEVDGNVLTRGTLLKAVAIAAGRANHNDRQGLPGSVTTAPALLSREEARRRGSLILVAEDNEINQKVILQQLKLLGQAADIAGNGREALELWRSGDYAILFADLHMPEMDGYQLTAAIRAAEKETKKTPIPVIAFTANVLKGEAEHCLAMGMDDYLRKPVQLVDLEAMLEKWMPVAAKTAPVEHISAGEQRGTQVTDPSLTLPLQEGGNIAVDMSVLKKLVGDDDAIVRDFLHDFRLSAARMAVELRTACAADQASAAGALAHKLKSSSRSVGALALGELCEKMEQAGTAGDMRALMALLPGFELELARVEGFLEGY